MTYRKHMSFNVDENTLKLIDELKREFSATSNAAVLKRPLALSRIAANTQNRETNTVTFVDHSPEKEDKEARQPDVML